jgi:curved DNA-binding protein CbpA
MDPQFVIELEALAQALDELDYFGILKLPETAGAAEIKAAYHAESRAYHPDRFAALPDQELKDRIARIYRRINEAYTVLRDDAKRKKYAADVSGPERQKKLRFTEADEVEVKEDQKRKVEEQFGFTPNGRKFYKAAAADIEAERWESAERNLKSALMYEPGNARFKEQLELVERSRPKMDQFKIR